MSLMTTRRDFLRQTATAMAAGIVLPEVLRAKALRASVSASDQINVALSDIAACVQQEQGTMGQPTTAACSSVRTSMP